MSPLLTTPSLKKLARGLPLALVRHRSNRIRPVRWGRRRSSIDLQVHLCGLASSWGWSRLLAEAWLTAAGPPALLGGSQMAVEEARGTTAVMMTRPDMELRKRQAK